MTCDGGKREVLGTRLHCQNNPGLKTWEGGWAAEEHHVSANQKMQWKDVGRESRLSLICQPTSTFLEASVCSLWPWPFKCQPAEGFLFLVKAGP